MKAAILARRVRIAARVTFWAVYPTFDIFLATDAGKILKKLTTAPGYDAEATHWKTKNVIFTSLASGDLDLWTMKPDGSNSALRHRKATTAAPFILATEKDRLARSSSRYAGKVREGEEPLKKTSRLR